MFTFIVNQTIKHIKLKHKNVWDTLHIQRLTMRKSGHYVTTSPPNFGIEQIASSYLDFLGFSLIFFDFGLANLKFGFANLEFGLGNPNSK